GRINISSGRKVLLAICATRPRKKPIRPIRPTHVDAKRDVTWPIVPAVRGSRSVHVSKAGGDIWRCAQRIPFVFDGAGKRRNSRCQRNYHPSKLHSVKFAFHPLQTLTHRHKSK